MRFIIFMFIFSVSHIASAHQTDVCRTSINEFENVMRVIVDSNQTLITIHQGLMAENKSDSRPSTAVMMLSGADLANVIHNEAITQQTDFSNELEKLIDFFRDTVKENCR